MYFRVWWNRKENLSVPGSYKTKIKKKTHLSQTIWLEAKHSYHLITCNTKHNENRDKVNEIVWKENNKMQFLFR